MTTLFSSFQKRALLRAAKNIVAATLFAVTISGGAFTDEPVDLTVIKKIKKEGFRRSEVMEVLQHLTDGIGPRLTGSPALMEANLWTQKKLTEWGLENARLEGFEFGNGWSSDSIQVSMTSPRQTQLYALPLAWHPGTNGTLEGEAIHAPLRSKRDFKKWRGKLKGKIVFVSSLPVPRPPKNEVFIRHDKESLAELSEYEEETAKDIQKEFEGWVRYKSFFYEREQFLAREGALAMVKRASDKAMLINAEGYQYKKGMRAQVPGISMAYEHYARAVRLMEAGETVQMRLAVDAVFHTENSKAYSTLADIQGIGQSPEIVLAGAHLDSWSNSDSASDNAAGVAVVMEAVRILKAIGAKPKRTIRVGLWGGEEQGYYGAQQYVLDHLIARPENTDERLKYMGTYERYFDQFPMSKEEEFDRFSVYFNLDNGPGKIRGIYAEHNQSAAAVFKSWFKPFHDLGAATVTLNSTGGTDHEPFDDVGLPAFQFIQDPLNYGSQLHHNQVDTYSHVYEEDLQQAAVILASFLYHAATRDERLPRKPLPMVPILSN